MVPEPALPTALSRELAALARVLMDAERDRERRLEAKLAELDARIDEAARIQRLITGGVARSEARLRVLEDEVEALTVGRFRTGAPRPLDLLPAEPD